MDTPHLPENEPEEITWQDDENRATLFLRSVFVALSGALILGAEFHTSFNQLWLEVLYLLGMNVVLPVCIIWFFFGQGLRPVEWLTDQKYNAWNYGVNFKDWKTHLKWTGVLFVLGILPCLLIFFGFLFHGEAFFSRNTISTFNNLGQHLFLLLCVSWLIVISVTWLIWGYLLFGCIQGFSEIPVFILIGIILSVAVVLGWSFFGSVVVILFFFFSFLGFISCWKTKSIAPMLYSVFFLITVCVLFPWALVFRSIT